MKEYNQDAPRDKRQAYSEIPENYIKKKEKDIKARVEKFYQEKFKKKKPQKKIPESIDEIILESQ